MNNTKSQNGKGSRPRNCFSNDFKNNYDKINWGHDKKEKYPSNEKRENTKQ
jgi:hypothetical protein